MTTNKLELDAIILELEDAIKTKDSKTMRAVYIRYKDKLTDYLNDTQYKSVNGRQ